MNTHRPHPGPRQRALLVAAAILLPLCAARAADPAGVTTLALETLDGDRFEMTSFDERRGTLLVFLSGRCPATDGQSDAIESHNETWRGRGILVVGLAANPAESGEELRTYCQRRGLRFPVYRDPDARAAALLGASVTPEAFLLDATGRVVYRGAPSGETLDAALAALAAGEDVAFAEVPVGGTALSEPGPPREVDDPHGTIFFESELVFNRAGDAAVHHSSTLAQAPNGTLLCVWYGGSYESADDQTLFLSRRVPGGRAWSQPQVLVRDSLRPPGNAVIFTDSRDRVWVVWGRMEGSRPVRRGGGWGDCRLYYRVSPDSGEHWSRDMPMPHGERTLPRAVPLRLSTGRLVLPLNGHADGASGSVFLLTDDAGETWVPSAFLPGGIQPTLLERRDGSLLAYLRGRPRILATESFDGGLTWSAPVPTALKCPNASIALAPLGGGKAVLVFNDSERERTPLSVALSRDDGETWDPPLVLEGNPGEYSYPCVLRAHDGLIHVTYTFRRYAIKHVVFNEEWLTHLSRPN